MTLEEILKTTKAVLGTAKQDLWDRPDEWIRKQYQKVATGDRRISRDANNFLNGGINLAMIISVPCYVEALKHDTTTLVHANYFGMCSAPLFMFEYVVNGIVKHNEHKRDFVPVGANESSVYVPKWIQKIERTIRFPYMIVTLLCFGEHMVTGTLPGIGYSIAGVSMAGGIISSMYIKDREPRQFKKDPFWKRAYDAAAEKITEYLPQPVPVPIPIPARSYISVATPSL